MGHLLTFENIIEFIVTFINDKDFNDYNIEYSKTNNEIANQV